MTKDKSHPLFGARERILAAYDGMVLDREPGRNSVGVVIGRAGVARSTFYTHFRSASHLEIEALGRPMGVLARMAAGDPCHDDVVHLLQHFWDYRADLRRFLATRQRQAAERYLASEIERRALGALATLQAVQLAAVVMATIELWVSGRHCGGASGLARSLERSCAAIADRLD